MKKENFEQKSEKGGKRFVEKIKKTNKNLPEQTEEFSNLDDWWLDEEDSADGLPVFDPERQKIMQRTDSV